MKTKVTFERAPDAVSLLPNLKSSAARGLPMVEKGCHTGEKALIVGTGPTLKSKDTFRRIKHLAQDRVVFALKEAVGYLKLKGIDVTYSVAMDPSGERQVARTPVNPDVVYCLASSCNPMLYDHILDGGAEVKIFHSACGQSEPYYLAGILHNAAVGQGEEHALYEGFFEMKTLDDKPFCPIIPMLKVEVELYEELFNNADCMTGGFTVTNRALSLVRYMGFEDVVMGATDFGWRKKGGSHYCDLVKVDHRDKEYMTDSCDVDGQEWFTKPDQLASAADIALKIKAGEVEVIGDSLAAALAKRDHQYISEICKLV